MTSQSRNDESPAGRTRVRYLETLLDRMTAPADLARQHLQEQNQNATLGLGAEMGVRELLQLVLPERLAVTSGFVRDVGADIRTRGMALKGATWHLSICFLVVSDSMNTRHPPTP